MNGLLRRALSPVYPHRCCICGAVQRVPCTVCETCAKYRLPETVGARCPVCGLRREACVCGGGRLYAKTLTFPFYFEGDVRASLLRLKYGRRTELIAPFAKEMADAALRRGVAAGTELVCFVPMDRRAARKRGFDQSALLAAEIGRLLDKPVLPLLQRLRQSAGRQHVLSAVERRGNLLGVFEPDPACVAQIDGRAILLVDDICTTGSTLGEAAKTLQIFGAERVDCLCAAARRKQKSED